MDAGELLSVDVIDDAEFNKEKFKQVLHHIEAVPQSIFKIEIETSSQLPSGNLKSS